MATIPSPLNVAWGFEIGDTAVVSVASADVGFVDGQVTVRVPRENRMLRADMYASPIDNTIVTKDAFIAFTMKEVTGANLAAAWGTGAYTSSSVEVKNTDIGQVSVIIVTNGPDGCTSTITMSKGVSIGDGTLTIPFAAGQTIAAEFQGVGDTADSGQLLSVVHS